MECNIYETQSIFSLRQLMHVALAHAVHADTQ